MLLLLAPAMPWGTFSCLNLDQMGLLNVTSSKRPYLHPGNFSKPPLLTYVTHFLVITPIEVVRQPLQWAGFSSGEAREKTAEITLVAARGLQFGFFALLLWASASLARRYSGRDAETATCVLLGSSAGLLPYLVFLTPEIAMTGLMMACLLCCGRIVENPGIQWSLLAGICAGLATGMKYNGLFIAPAIPLAHLLAEARHPWLAIWRRPTFHAGCWAVPVTFLLTNPYAILDWRAFWQDFYYNYRVTPVYGGQEGLGYGAFLEKYLELFGPLTSLLLIPLLGAGVYRIVQPGLTRPARCLWLLAAVCLLLYFWKIGSFPRMETRFVLPTVPLLLILAAPGWTWLFSYRRIAVGLLAILGGYGMACGVMVSRQFALDPRQAGAAWAKAHFPARLVVERSGSAPDWKYMKSREIKSHRIPEGFDRKTRFDEAFAGDASMQEALARNEKATDIGWFSPSARQSRGTTVITFSNIDFTDSPMRQYFETLEASDSGFSIAFDRESPSLPWWVYPQKTEFLRNRFVIFVNSDGNDPDSNATQER